MMMSRIKGRRGVVLPYVLIVGAVAMLLGATIFTAANASTALSKSGVSDRQAYLNAKSGIEYAKGVIAKDAKTGTLKNFFVVGKVNDVGQAEFAVSTSIPASIENDIYAVCTVAKTTSTWDVKIVSTGRGNAASKNDVKGEQKLVFTAHVTITPSLDVPGVVGVIENGGGFDPTIMVNDGTTYTTPELIIAGYRLTSTAPPTDYSILFQTPIKGGNGTGLSAEKLYFAAGTGKLKKGESRAVSLGIASNARVDLQADYLYIKDTLSGESGAKLFLTPKNSASASTMVYFAPGSKISIVGMPYPKEYSDGALFRVPSGTDFLDAIKQTSIAPLERSNADFQAAMRFFDVAVLKLSIPSTTGLPALSSLSFISGGTAGWATSNESAPLLAGGSPSNKTGKTVCLYATGGDGAEWTSATAANTEYKADVVRTIWNNATPWSIPAPKSTETSFTVTTDLLSLNIGSKNTSGSIEPVAPTSSFIVKSKTGLGNAILYVARSTDVIQATGAVVNLTPGWHSVRSGTDLFRMSEFDLDTLLVSNDVMMIDGNQGTDLLKYVSQTGKMSFEGNIAIPKNKAVEAVGTVFNFTGSEVLHNQKQGNQKQTLLLYTPSKTGDALVTFEKDITIEQISGALVKFQAGSYTFSSGIDLLNIGTNMPKPYVPGFDFAFSDSVFR